MIKVVWSTLEYLLQLYLMLVMIVLLLLFSCSVQASSGLTPPGVYEDAVADFEKQFPQFAKYGWGPSVQAEKWNGRHAMCK